METEHVVRVNRARPRRRRRFRNANLFWGQALIGSIRGAFYVWEIFASPRNKMRLRELREKLNTADRDRDAALRDVKQGRDGVSILESVEERMGKYMTPEMRSSMAASNANIRALRQEGETLQKIIRDAGEDHGRAVAECREYVREHTESALGYSYLGMSLKKAGDNYSSLQAYQEAIDLEPVGSLGWALNRRHHAEVLQAMGNFEDAVSEFQQILDAEIETPESMRALIYLDLGKAFHEMGKRNEARDAWKQAIRWDSTKVVAKTARELLAANP